MLETFPEVGTVTEAAMGAVIEKLLSLPPDLRDRACSVTEGLPTKCRYFPTVWDITEFAKDWESRRPAQPTGYKYFEPEPPFENGSLEHRKAVVKRALKEPIFPPDDPRTDKRLKAKDFRTSADLHTPQRPVSDELKDLLRRQDSGEEPYPS